MFHVKHSISCFIFADCIMKLIAREIGCSPTTVSNEIKRGTIPMYKNRSPHYRAKAGQAVYEANRHNSCRTYDYVLKSKLINYVSDHFFNDSWSLDACCGRAITEGKFTRDEMVCEKIHLLQQKEVPKL